MHDKNMVNIGEYCWKTRNIILDLEFKLLAYWLD